MLEFVIIVAVVLLIVLLLPSKGRAGERAVARRLRFLRKRKYEVFNDVLLHTQGGTTQIDHVVVSVYGIFVIETKNYQGWIYGGENSEYWTQNIYGRKHSFYNPILQNAGHVRTLKHLLADYAALKIIPIVAFSNKASIRFRYKSCYVIRWWRLLWLIWSFKEPCISGDQVDEICTTLRRAQMENTLENKVQHVRNVRSVQCHKHFVAMGRCPRCGHELVLRDGKYGKFYGCSNYPHCIYTQPMK